MNTYKSDIMKQKKAKLVKMAKIAARINELMLELDKEIYNVEGRQCPLYCSFLEFKEAFILWKFDRELLIDNPEPLLTVLFDD